MRQPAQFAAAPFRGSFAFCAERGQSGEGGKRELLIILDMKLNKIKILFNSGELFSIHTCYSCFLRLFAATKLLSLVFLGVAAFSNKVIKPA